MKDIHSHLLYGIDDGSKSIEESIELLVKMSKSGVTDVMLTPHYVENSEYVCNNKDKRLLFKELKDKVKALNIDINLYLGNEVYFSENIVDLIKNKEVLPLNNTKYVLFEFPLNNMYKNSICIISELIRKGYTPIMAHPERYRIFQKHPELAADYVRMGVLLQGNFTSIYGKYGRAAEKTIKYFIKRGWLSFLGSDTHHDVSFSEKKIRKLLHRVNRNKDYIESLLNTNFDIVVNNENMEIKRYN